MKKTVSILMTIAVMAAMITAFMIPASAQKYPRAEEIFQYIRIDGIDGDSGSAFNYDHERWIDIISAEQGFENVNGKTYTKLTFKHYIDRATPAIQENLKNGTVIESANFHTTTFCNWEEEETVIYNLHLENITIVSAVYNGISTDVNGNTVYPTETVTLLAEISTVNVY